MGLLNALCCEKFTIKLWEIVGNCSIEFTQLDNFPIFKQIFDFVPVFCKISLCYNNWFLWI